MNCFFKNCKFFNVKNWSKSLCQRALILFLVPSCPNDVTRASSRESPKNFSSVEGVYRISGGYAVANHFVLIFLRIFECLTIDKGGAWSVESHFITEGFSDLIMKAEDFCFYLSHVFCA